MQQTDSISIITFLLSNKKEKKKKKRKEKTEYVVNVSNAGSLLSRVYIHTHVYTHTCIHKRINAFVKETCIKIKN